MAIAFVQSRSVRLSGVSSPQTLAFSSNNDPSSDGNHLIIVCGRFGTSGTTLTITDSAGNSYGQVQGYPVDGTTSPDEGFMFFAPAVHSNTANTITISWSGGASTSIDFAILEYSGVKKTSPLDGSNQNNATSGASSITSGSITTTGVDLVFSMAECATPQGAGGWTVNTPWTGVENASGNGFAGTNRACAEYQLNVTASSYNASFTLGTATGFSCIIAAFLPDTGSSVIVVDEPELQQQRFVASTRMESQHQHELQDTFAIPPQLPPFAFEDDGANIRWSDWRALHYEDPETQRALPPVPPVSIQEEFTESLNVDWRARQYEDTDTHRALPPTPPFAIQDEHQDEKNFSWSAIQYDEIETQRALPPTPPPIQDEISERGLPGVTPFFEEDQAPKPIVAAPAPNIGLDDIEAHVKAFDRVGVYHEDDLSTPAPIPPFSLQDDEQHTWRGWLAPAIEDDWRALPPLPPFVVPDDTAEKWTATSAPAIEDDQATLPPVPPIVPFSIQDEEQQVRASWLSPAIEDDWSTTAPTPPLAYEDDLKTISANPIFFPIVDSDFTGKPPVPSFFGDDEQSLQRYAVAGLSGLILLDEFVGAPIVSGLGPFTISSLSASVRPAIDSKGAAIRPSIDSQFAAVRPAIDSQGAIVRPS